MLDLSCYRYNQGERIGLADQNRNGEDLPTSDVILLGNTNWFLCNFTEGKTNLSKLQNFANKVNPTIE